VSLRPDRSGGGTDRSCAVQPVQTSHVGSAASRLASLSGTGGGGESLCVVSQLMQNPHSLKWPLGSLARSSAPAPTSHPST
jgi:hypothetical protein